MTQFWRRWIFVWACGLICSSAACNDPGCIRHSNCPSGTICSQGACIQPPTFDAARSSDAVLPKDALSADHSLVDAAGAKDKGASDFLLDGLHSEAGKPDAYQKDGSKSDSIKADAILADGMKRDSITTDAK